MVKNFGWKKKDEKPLWRKNLGEKKMENCQNDENIWVKKKRWKDLWRKVFRWKSKLKNCQNEEKKLEKSHLGENFFVENSKWWKSFWVKKKMENCQMVENPKCRTAKMAKKSRRKTILLKVLSGELPYGWKFIM